MFPGTSFVWRLEFQQRGAPHFHLLLSAPKALHGDADELAGFCLNFRSWLAEAWYRIVGSGDVKHRQAGTQCDLLRTFRGAAWYAAKYCTKPDSRKFDGVGRFWGVVGRKDWFAAVLSCTLRVNDIVRIRRILRRWRRPDKRAKRAWCGELGVRCFIEAEALWRLVRHFVPDAVVVDRGVGAFCTQRDDAVSSAWKEVRLCCDGAEEVAEQGGDECYSDDDAYGPYQSYQSRSEAREESASEPGFAAVVEPSLW